MVTFRRRDGSGAVEYRWITEDTDRHGNVRLYVRRPGARKVRLRQTPGTDAFDAEYRAALEAGAAAPATNRQAPAQAGSLRWLCARYYESAEFKALDPRTRYVYRQRLDRFCAHRRGGDKPYRLIESQHIARRRDEITSAPEGGNNIIKALRRLFAWAALKHVKLAEPKWNPAAEVPFLRGKPDGWHSWTPDEIRKFEARHPVGSKARLALALLLYTGARRSDVVRLGRQMERDGWLSWTAHKGRNRSPVVVTLPILPALRAAIDACPSGHMTYLVTDFGRPFTSNGFGNKMREWCDQAGLPHCSAHGLRKAGAANAAEKGATEHQLMAIYGWKTIQEAERYTRAARRKILAGAAATFLERDPEGAKSSNPVPLFKPAKPGGTKAARKPLKNKT